jgi:hypothetical protein
MPTKYAHTNLVAHNWKRLALFYETVFGCVPIPPERDLSGDWLDKVTGIPGAHIRGTHLQLPGYEQGGPTLEIFHKGGSAVGELTVREVPGIGVLTVRYVADPEGNIIEIQSWN